MNTYWEITRPFTLPPPFLGIVSGSFAALGVMAAAGAMPLSEGLARYWPYMLVGGLMGSVLNASSNVFNQYTEIDLDRANKPGRVLPSGRMSPRAALVWSIFLYAVALALGWFVQPYPGARATFLCACAAALATILYSAKPPYLKGKGWGANFTIAVPRGCLLKVAGWGCVAPVADIEPWFIGTVFFLFLFGAASSKDFSDYAGDKAGGVRTVVVEYGLERSARLIAPFFVLPWLLLAAGVWIPRFWEKVAVDAAIGGDAASYAPPLLHSSTWATTAIGLALAGYGVYIARLMRNASAASVEGNHPAWKHMYLMMMAAQLGLIVCYLV